MAPIGAQSLDRRDFVSRPPKKSARMQERVASPSTCTVQLRAAAPRIRIRPRQFERITQHPQQRRSPLACTPQPSHSPSGYIQPRVSPCAGSAPDKRNDATAAAATTTARLGCFRREVTPPPKLSPVPRASLHFRLDGGTIPSFADIPPSAHNDCWSEPPHPQQAVTASSARASECRPRLEHILFIDSGPSLMQRRERPFSHTP